MCGLAGIASNIINNDDEKVFRDLLLMASLRGIDSTGVATISGKKVRRIDIRKITEDAWFFLQSSQCQEVFKPHDRKVLLGHCRSATVGKATNINAHPFQTETYVGAHNGTITGNIDHKENDGTDSEALFKNIEEKGIKEGMHYLEDRGWQVSYALSFFNKKDNTLHFLRNAQRPLHYAINDEVTTLYWLSEPELLEAVLKRNGIKNKGIQSLEVNSLMTIDMKVANPIDSLQIEGKFVPPKKPYVYQSELDNITPPWIMDKEAEWENSWKDFDKMYGPEVEADLKPKSLSCLTQKHLDRTALITSVIKKQNKDYFRGYNKRLLTRKMFEELLDNGCQWCQQTLKIGSPVRWIDYNSYLCLDCANDPYISGQIPKLQEDVRG